MSTGGAAIPGNLLLQPSLCVVNNCIPIMQPFQGRELLPIFPAIYFPVKFFKEESILSFIVINVKITHKKSLKGRGVHQLNSQIFSQNCSKVTSNDGIS